MTTETHICPECNGTKVVEHESARPIATPDGPRWQYWRDDCQTCGGEGEVEVFPIEMKDLPPSHLSIVEG